MPTIQKKTTSPTVSSSTGFFSGFPDSFMDNSATEASNTDNSGKPKQIAIKGTVNEMFKNSL